MATLCTGPTEAQPNAPALVYVGNANAHAYYPSASLAFKWLIDYVLPGTEMMRVSDLCAYDPGTPTDITPADFLSIESTWTRPELYNKLLLAARVNAFNAYCQCAAVPPTENPSTLCSAGATELTLNTPFQASRPIGSIFANLAATGTSGKWTMATTGGDRYGMIAPFGYASEADAEANTGAVQLHGWQAENTDYPWSHLDKFAYVQYRWYVNGPFEWQSASISYDVCLHNSGSAGSPAYEPTVPPPGPEPEGLPAAPQCAEVTLCELSDGQAHLSDQIWRLTQIVSNLQAEVPGPRTAEPVTTPVTTPQQEIPVSAIRAAVVTYTVPVWIGQIVGSPPIDLLVGYVTLGTPAGWLPPIRLEHSPQVIEPIPSTVDKIRLSLTPGVIGSVDTYSREGD